MVYSLCNQLPPQFHWNFLKPCILNVAIIKICMCCLFFFVFNFFLKVLELILTQLWPLEIRCFRHFFFFCIVRYGDWVTDSSNSFQ